MKLPGMLPALGSSIGAALRQAVPRPRGGKGASARAAAARLATYLPSSRRSLVTIALTSLASAGLLVVLLLRVIAAGQQVASLPPYPLLGHSAPDFTLSLWNGTPGQTIHLAALRGHPVVVNFWASWCDACRQEEPALVAAAGKYGPEGVVFIGVAFHDTQQAGTAFLREFGVTFPSGPDPTGQIMVAYGIPAIPETVFIDRRGKVVSHIGGAISAATLDAQIQALLKG